MNPFRPALALCATLLLGAQETAPLKLPAPAAEGASLAAALKGRATLRALTGPALTQAEAAQLLWAAQGENRPGKRTVPSAHAAYPLEVYLLTAGSPDLAAGLYHYLPEGHRLARLGEGTPDTVLGQVKGMQGWLRAAPAVFLVACDPPRAGKIGKNLTYYEAGAAAQALLLQAAALGLGSGTATGVDLEAVAKAAKLSADVLVLLPVGHPKK